ncbi:Appr-1-p processing protein [Kineococcus endophyticus]|uniref:Appr-1-p processing protein n=1 Tax=Kineococcus endophyticus TaxID=1181883 RepID=A0ABV3PDU3_9ACTN
MQGGIAVEFRRRWPRVHAAYPDLCAARDLQIEDLSPCVTDDLVVCNLVTQQDSGANTRLDAVDCSVRAALLDAETREIDALGMPWPRAASAVAGSVKTSSRVTGRPVRPSVVTVPRPVIVRGGSPS